MSETYEAAAEIRGAILALNETMSEICSALADIRDTLQDMADHKDCLLKKE